MPSAANDLERRLRIDPLIVAAKDDVDLTLIEWFLTLSPMERLDACHRMAAELMRLRDAASESR